MTEQIGITERGDAALDLSWKPWVEDNKPAILITKDPLKLAQHLNSNYRIVVHCTITGHGNSPLEPNVPCTETAMHGFHEIRKLLLPEQVILRVDPIILSPFGQEKADGICRMVNNLSKLTVRISFLDNYNHVKERFRQSSVSSLGYDFHAPLENRVNFLKKLKLNYPNFTFEVCGEPGMECTGCISVTTCKTLTVKPAIGYSKQRNSCACLAQKKELLNNRKQCAHGCLYCYWK